MTGEYALRMPNQTVILVVYGAWGVEPLHSF